LNKLRHHLNAGSIDRIWFAAMASPAEYPWRLHFGWKLLHNDAHTLSLLANNPFPNAPRHYIRARLYRYQFAPIGDHSWWKREPIGEWWPALSTDDAEFRRLRGDGLVGLTKISRRRHSVGLGQVWNF
jgi:hypothetical protein